MGAIGYSMDGSGLDVLWQTVYAGATVQHMLNGHAYARALRAPLSDISRANNPSPIKPHCLDHVDTNQLRQKLSSLIDKDCDIHDIQVDLLIKNFVDVIERASVDVAAFRTGKLWINYIRQITILKLFIHAERAVIGTCISSNNSQTSIVRHHTSIGTSMQVVRARTSETTRRFYMWLSANSPFVYTCESVVCLSTGMVAGKIVNCDNAFEVGCIAASDMTNGNFSDVKLKRNDKVKNIASMTNTVTIPNKCVTINPAVLFSRITCILRDSSEMEKGTMDNEAIVVFDGYECTTSTKSAEQKRRATKSSSRDIMFDESMQTVTTQSAFSSNDRNKTRLISMLVQKFKDKFIKRGKLLQMQIDS
ncbi:hypothetical protein GQR58_005644 [Nymphon striatum]|nr:hypothetical protein GQR58_005644 [Nymphon striatum]